MVSERVEQVGLMGSGKHWIRLLAGGGTRVDGAECYVKESVA